MVKQLSIDNEVLKQVPDLREEVRNKVFQKPLDKRYKWLFATIVLMRILIVFRLLTHVVLWVPMERLAATERVLLRKKRVLNMNYSGCKIQNYFLIKMKPYN